MIEKGIEIAEDSAIIHKRARELARNNFAKRAVEIDLEGKFPSANIQDLKDHGFLNLGIPENPASIKTIIATIEEFAQSCPSTSIIYLMHISLLPSLYKLSTAHQKETLLKDVFAGKKLGSYSQSEKSTGTRAWYVESFAEKEDKNYLLNCFKSFSTGSGHCDFYSVITRDHKDATDNELAIFYVDGKDPNVEVIGKWDGMGLRGTSSTPLNFKNVKVPYVNKIGEETKNEEKFYILMAFTYPIYIIGLSAIFYGVAKLAFDEALHYVKNRTYNENGEIKHLKDVGVMHKFFAEMKLLLDETKNFMNAVAEDADRHISYFEKLADKNMLHKVLDEEHETFFSKQSQLKILSSEMAIKVTNMAMEVMGGSGYKRGGIIERCYRDARAGTLMNPSNNTLKMILGRLELGVGLPWN
jgi:alkylation response protein AidB-like acyl-CoA dehydrogenase